MCKPNTKAPLPTGGDPLLREIWRIKDELSASYGHDIHRLFADLREREQNSGHPVVDLSAKRPKR